jgi:hypothetical protein
MPGGRPCGSDDRATDVGDDVGDDVGPEESSCDGLEDESGERVTHSAAEPATRATAAAAASTDVRRVRARVTPARACTAARGVDG